MTDVTTQEDEIGDVGRATNEAQRIANNIKNVIIGKDDAVDLAVIGLLCQGHVLIEDLPGVGKTMLAKSVARSIGCAFKRIQFTPDLLPTDITGVSVYNQKSGAFEFKQGPIISQFVLADEINRATPKTQSALLESMEERQVTVEGTTHQVPRPFMVMATQNPIEYEGTFPLPEAQLDRFLLMISLGYPSMEEELEIVENQRTNHPIDNLEPVVDAEDIISLQNTTRRIYVDDLIKRYIVAVIKATRNHPDISLGASPRGSLSLYRGSQAMALVRGRDFALPDDVKALARPMLTHRIIVSAAAKMRGVRSNDVIDKLLDEVPVPGAEVRKQTGD